MFSGPHLVRPRRLVLMILFGFEVDTLEIALREQLTLVDKVFIVESSVTHKGVRFRTLILLLMFDHHNKKIQKLENFHNLFIAES